MQLTPVIKIILFYFQLSKIASRPKLPTEGGERRAMLDCNSAEWCILVSTVPIWIPDESGIQMAENGGISKSSPQMASNAGLKAGIQMAKFSISWVAACGKLIRILTSRIVFSFSVVDSMKPANRAQQLIISSLEIFSHSSGKNFFAMMLSEG